MISKEMEIENLLLWAFREELPKKQLSVQEMCWDSMAISGPFGPIDEGISVQRYAYVGEPHADARIIEKAVDALPLVVIDWEESLEAIMGDLCGLVSVNDLTRQTLEERPTKSGWTDGRRHHENSRNPPASHDLRGKSARDVLLVGSVQVAELVATHARQGTRPKWYSQPATCHPTPSRDPSKALLIGQSGGRNLYSIGSHCPISWGIKRKDDKYGDKLITPVMIALARADYIGWWRGLSMLAESLVLAEHVALPPTAPRLPWFNPEPSAAVFGQRSPPKMPALPLKPLRERAGPMRGQGEDVAKRSPGRRIER